MNCSKITVKFIGYGRDVLLGNIMLFELLISRFWLVLKLGFWRHGKPVAADYLRSWFLTLVDLVSFAGLICCHEALIDLFLAIRNYTH